MSEGISMVALAAMDEAKAGVAVAESIRGLAARIMQLERERASLIVENERLRAQEPKYLDSEGVGKFLGISETLARKLMKAGKLPVVVIPSTSNAEERELRRCLNTELVEFLRKRSAP